MVNVAVDLDKIKAGLTNSSVSNLKASTHVTKKSLNDKVKTEVLTEIYTVDIKSFKDNFKDLNHLRDLNWKNLDFSKGKDTYQSAQTFATKTLNSNLIEHKSVLK